mmetsp:Transcript_17275/g.37266  ORF Transcript_17275/g.37266 Transcript_17275/m.37266 type:complete len:817 (+) Transcript_17275:245-2695(+)
MQAGTSLKSSIHTTYSRVAHTRGSGSIDVLLTRCRAHAAPLFQAHHLALAVDASLGAATAAPCEIRRPSLSAPTVPPTGTDNGAIRDADLHNKPSVSGPMNPARLAALSQLLRMPLKMVERLLERNPRLLQITPDGLQLQLEQLSRELRLPQRTITAMFCKQPGLLAHTPAADVRIRAEALASELRVPPADVVQWARRIPVVLRRHPSVVRRRLKRLAELYGVEVKAMAQMASEAPQYLTDSYTSIQSRLQAMCKMLHRPQRLVVRMLQRQPDLVFISPRVLANKLKVLQAILNKDHRHIVTLVMRTPKLLRSPLDAVRATFKGLPGLMGLQEGVVYAMACHEPALLLEPLPALTQRLRRIRRATQASSTWAQEWKKMNPAQLADCLLVTNVTYQRLDFLAAQKQGPSLGLRDALMMARTDFAKRWPEFEVKLQQQAAAAAAAAAHSHGAHALAAGLSKVQQAPAGLGLQEVAVSGHGEHVVVDAPAVAPALQVAAVAAAGAVAATHATAYKGSRSKQLSQQQQEVAAVPSVEQQRQVQQRRRRRRRQRAAEDASAQEPRVELGTSSDALAHAAPGHLVTQPSADNGEVAELAPMHVAERSWVTSQPSSLNLQNVAVNEVNGMGHHLAHLGTVRALEGLPVELGDSLGHAHAKPESLPVTAHESHAHADSHASGQYYTIHTSSNGTSSILTAPASSKGRSKTASGSYRRNLKQHLTPCSGSGTGSSGTPEPQGHVHSFAGAELLEVAASLNDAAALSADCAGGHEQQQAAPAQRHSTTTTHGSHGSSSQGNRRTSGAVVVDRSNLQALPTPVGALL